MEIPETLDFTGPFWASLDTKWVDALPDTACVYIWCVEVSELFFRVHYVGETNNLSARMATHAKKQRDGAYSAFDPEALKGNKKVIQYRAGIGLVENYQNEDPQQINKYYFESLAVFFAPLPPQLSRPERCYFETAVAHSVEDYGANVLAVERLNRPRPKRQEVRVNSNGCRIEGLTGEIVLV